MGIREARVGADGTYLLAVDGGTESLRAAVVTPTGNVLAKASASYATHYPAPGWAEQAPADWWHGLGKAVRTAVAQAGIAPAAIAGLSLDTTSCTVVLMDAQGRAVRPALLWMDVRASAEARQASASTSPALAVNGAGANAVSAEWLWPKLLWLKRHEPANLDAAALVGEYQEYMTYNLTGLLRGSLMTAAARWHYNAERPGYPRQLITELGLEDMLAKLPHAVLAMGVPIGELTPAAAAHLGLPQHVLVVQGGADAYTGALGMGVDRPARLGLITGSSHLLVGLSDQPRHTPGVFGTYRDALIPGLHMAEGGQASTGAVVAWYRNLLGGAVSYERLNAEAAEVPPGADGLVVLDHFQGNRNPYTDPDSRGLIAGLGLHHTRGHIYRAILEGIALGTELIRERMAASGLDAEAIAVCGGATNAELWLQLHADILGRPLQVPRVTDGPILGCAILAAVGCGLYRDTHSAVAAMVSFARTIAPRPAIHRQYQELVPLYRDLYPAMADIHRRRSSAAQA